MNILSIVLLVVVLILLVVCVYQRNSNYKLHKSLDDANNAYNDVARNLQISKDSLNYFESEAYAERVIKQFINVLYTKSKTEKKGYVKSGLNYAMAYLKDANRATLTIVRKQK